jgi:hypothetical protein
MGRTNRRGFRDLTKPKRKVLFFFSSEELFKSESVKSKVRGGALPFRKKLLTTSSGIHRLHLLAVAAGETFNVTNLMTKLQFHNFLSGEIMKRIHKTNSLRHRDVLWRLLSKTMESLISLVFKFPHQILHSQCRNVASSYTYTWSYQFSFETDAQL